MYIKYFEHKKLFDLKNNNAYIISKYMLNYQSYSKTMNCIFSNQSCVISSL